MKPKTTLLLLALGLGIYAFIHFYESGLPSSQEAASREGLVLQFDRDKVDRIALTNKETKIKLGKGKDGKWMLEAPVQDRADRQAISQLLTAAETLKAETVPSDKKGGMSKDQLREFGLRDSDTRLEIKAEGKTQELLFGKDAAVEGKVYARLEGSNDVQVIGSDLKTQMAKKVEDFRDHLLTDLVTTQVARVAVKTTAGEIELTRKDQHWTLAKPLKARGNDQKIGDLISQIANAHIDSFAGDSSNLGAYGLQEPRGTFTLFTEDSQPPTVLQIGRAEDGDKVFAKLSSRDSVVVLPKSIEALLELKPNDLRDRNLVRVETDIVDRLTIESASGEKIVLARSGEAWVRKAEGKDVPINSAAAAQLLSEVQRQQVVDFVADIATELPKYGLDQPRIKVTLSSYASENTAETKAGEKPILSVSFGRSEGDQVYAKLDDEPFIVRVASGMLELAKTDPLAWQELAIFKNKPEEIVSLELARQGQPTLTLARNKDKKWTLAKGDGRVNEVNLESLVNTLASLRAVRWAGAVKPEQGLSQPAIMATFKLASGAGGKLAVGATMANDVTFATAEEASGAFVISRPDLSALQLPLIDAAPAAAAASTPAASPAAALPEASPAP